MMKTKALKEKLQKNYQAMLETIEVLINKEGHSLKEAFHHAEEKLSEIEELSREEIQEISDTVKQDLHSLSETLLEAKEAYKEQIKLNIAYMTEGLIDTLMKIADSNTAQLIEFKNKIAEEARKTSADVTTLSNE